MAASLRIGTSGWHYDHWAQIFYPRGLPKSEWFPFYARFFDTVEINNSFYRLPSAETFTAWRRRAPAGFCYAVKFSRFGSHLKRLTDARSTINYFLAAAERLGRTLGPILIQLPPRWRANPERLNSFLAEAPRRQRWAVEFRDPSWLTDEVFSILEKHRAALCLHDMIKDHPAVLTTDWTYLRYHGEKSHRGNYTRPALEKAADRISEFLEQRRDVYVYFNNDVRGYAIKNALTLGNILARRSEPTVMARSSL
jgi:uncharacterized protein YecE (DUF72 family)